jgi:hypothetical protein
MTYLLLVTAIGLSAIAAYYSIMGLIAIFAAAAMPIAIMGGILEAAKLVVASWLYRNWKETPVLIKSYFVTAVGVLMLLTSMGIFGFLSKAHMDQNLVSGDVTAKLSIIEEKIKIEKETIDAARKTIAQLDSQVNETLSRSTSEDGAARSARLRRSQASERTQAQKAILSSQENINKLNTEKAPIAAEVRKVEAEVGPIKYIAALIYDEATGQETLEKAVRWVILLIVFVFDPLAVLMFIAVNQDIKRRQQAPVTAFPSAVNDQITDAVTQAPSKSFFEMPTFSMPEIKMPTFSMPKREEKEEPKEEKKSFTYSTINAIKQSVKKKDPNRELESERKLEPVVGEPEEGDNEKLIKAAKEIVVKQ